MYLVFQFHPNIAMTQASEMSCPVSGCNRMESIEMPRVQAVAVVGRGMERGRERKRQRGRERDMDEYEGGGRVDLGGAGEGRMNIIAL